LLTERDYSDRLRELLGHWPQADANDVSILRAGRIFWLKMDSNRTAALVIGRSESDNAALVGLARLGDCLISLPDDTPGPTALLRGSGVHSFAAVIDLAVPGSLAEAQSEAVPIFGDDAILFAARLCAAYAPKLRGRYVRINIRNC
jgi:hypothetical protein